MDTIDLSLNFSQLQRLFGVTETRDAFYSLADDEADDSIPTPLKTRSGYRYWPIESLPQISTRYRALATPVSGIAPIISCYVTKGGGSHKTTDAFNLASYLGISGKKVLVVGLDFQLNISKKLGIDNSIHNVKATGLMYKGIADVLEHGVDIGDVIVSSTIPNVDLIPESPNLVRLEAWLVGQVRREEKIKNKLEPLRKYYDVIIIDNNPSWSQLSISSLCACDINVASVGIDSNSNEALPQFFEAMELSGIMPEHLILALGMMEKTNLKKEIKSHLEDSFKDLVSRSVIRKSTAVDEANALHLPVFLYKPKEGVSEDYMNLCEEIWDRAVYAVDKNQGMEASH
jgi:chromosome partitioning protein